MSEEGKEEVYIVGDRVILRGLKNAAHLNGRHGHVGNGHNGGPVPALNGRYAVNLDLLDASTPKVSVQPTNLKREVAIAADIESKRAPAANACIAESYGRPMCVILDAVRFITAKYLMDADGVEEMTDIERMRFEGDQQELSRLNHFLAMAWSHWLDSGSFSSVDSVYEMSRQWAQVQMVDGLKQAPDPAGEGKELVKFMSDAFDDITSVKSWHVRVHGDFWVVGSDSEGTYLIPLDNQDIVYQTVGLTSNLGQMVQSSCGNAPAAFTVTMIPVNGRLLYDGVVTPAGGRAIMEPKTASATLTAKLRATVREAKTSGRVVQRLRQLEVVGGSLEGLPTQGNIEKVIKDEDQKPATAEEKKLIKNISKHTKKLNSNDPKGTWVFRRFGYTEQDNPEHFGVIISGGDVLGQFICAQGLAPVSIDILASTAKMCIQFGGLRPTIIMVDDFSCCERVKFLLKGIAAVDYYHPPSPEETAAAMAGPRP